MFNRINKLFPPRQLRIPLVSLLLVGGVVAVGSSMRPVVSSQLEYISTLTNRGSNNQVETHTWLQRHPTSYLESAPQKEARLRRALTNSVASSKVADSRIETYTWLQRNSLEQPVPQRQGSAVQNYLHSSSEILANKLKARHNKNLIATQTPAEPKTKFPTQNGVYLYGQSPKANQLGQGYIIFEKQQNSLVGALYMPSSEFSCFNGTLSQSGKLAMTVTGYPGDQSPTQIATSSLTNFSGDGPALYSHSVALNEYYQLNSISPNDRQILQTCKSHH